jgi:phosphoribosylaminoimidazole (AIR) synthetase
VKPVLDLLRTVPVKGLAHITGGGITENVPRVLPANVVADLRLASWELPPVFQWLQKQGRVADAEMHRVFNCGIGMVPASPCNCYAGGGPDSTLRCNEFRHMPCGYREAPPPY